MSRLNLSPGAVWAPSSAYLGFAANVGLHVTAHSRGKPHLRVPCHAWAAHALLQCSPLGLQNNMHLCFPLSPVTVNSCCVRGPYGRCPHSAAACTSSPSTQTMHALQDETAVELWDYFGGECNAIVA